MNSVRLRLTPILLCSVLLANRAHARDFHAPAERPTKGTAYTADAKQKVLSGGLFGTTYSDMIAAIGLSYAPTRFFEAGINLAHLGIGVLNINTKFTMLDLKGFGIGFDAGFLYAHGDWIWALPPLEKALMQGLDLFIIPLQLIFSADATRWLHFDLTAEYDHVEVLGDLSGKHLFYNGEIGASQFLLRPMVRFYIKNRVSFNVDGKLPIWGRVREEVEAEIRLTEGVAGGVRSAGYRELEPLRAWLVTTGIELEVNTGFYINTGLSIGSFSKAIFRRRMHMGIRLEWRF